MNRNVESHFSLLPSADIKRSIFSRPSTHKTSFNCGELIPIYIDEVLPGDSFQCKTSKVVRLQTLLTPIMDNVYLDTYWFFVPNRLVWSHWREFCGENSASAWAPSTSYQIPVISSPSGGFNTGTIADFFGLPVGKTWTAVDGAPSALPFRGYALICNEFFRDENLTDPLNIPTGDSNQTGTNGSLYINDVANGGMPFKVAKYHDYFTSCLPAPQKGTPPMISIGGGTFTGGDFPVYSKDSNIADSFFPAVISANSAMRFKKGRPVDESTSDSTLYRGTSTGVVYLSDSPAADLNSGDTVYYPANLWANLPNQTIGTAGSFSINDLRIAFAAQRFLEKNARGGSRYTEILRQHFGVLSPDARLQRPEYLGGNRVPLQVHQVSNTAQGEQDFLGDLGAMSVTGDVHFDFEKSFVEHGYLFCLCCVRYDHTYSQGLERFWTRRDFLDFYWPTFANIGEQPVFTNEIFFDASKMTDVFGYQEAWADYRYKPNRVSSEMRPGVTNSLSIWHLADNYASAPTLSDSWIREDKTNLDRCLAVQSSAANQVFCDFFFDMVTTRPMPMFSIPGLLDHN